MFFTTFIVLLLTLLYADVHVVCTKHFSRIWLDLGGNLGPHVIARIRNHIEAVTSVEILEKLESFDSETSDNNSYSLILALGNSSFSRTYRNGELSLPLDGRDPESFAMRSRWVTQSTLAIVSDGLPLNQRKHANVSFDTQRVHYGAVVGAYAALEQIGFGFLHPLAPSVPHRLRAPAHVLDVVESPYWSERAFHLHTQHPLELTEVLQGHDIRKILESLLTCFVDSRLILI
jgi:hypothetical protein